MPFRGNADLLVGQPVQSIAVLAGGARVVIGDFRILDHAAEFHRQPVGGSQYALKFQAQHFVIDANLAQHAADLLRAYRQRLVAGEKPGREHIQPGAAQPNAGLDKLQFGRLVGQAEIGPGGGAEARHVKVGEIQRGEAKIVGVGVARVNGEPLVEGVVGPQRPGEIVDPGAACVHIAVAKHRGAVVRQHLRIVQGAGDGDAAAHILTAGAERGVLVAQAGVEAQVFGQLVFDV